jgi:hypothetical protein
MPANLKKLVKGDAFTVARQAQHGGKPDKLIYISSKGYQCLPPETGTILEALGPEVPKENMFWVFRQATGCLHHLVGNEVGNVVTTFGSGHYKCHENILFG